MSGEILTRDEVAALLDCEPKTVEMKVRAGELPGVKFGRSWVFPRDALMQRLNDMALNGGKKPRLALKPAPVRLREFLEKN